MRQRTRDSMCDTQRAQERMGETDTNTQKEPSSATITPISHLGNVQRGHVGLVEEDAAKVVAVRKNLGLLW